MTKDEALKLALEALEEIHVGNMTPMAEANWNKAIVAIKEALAQSDQESDDLTIAYMSGFHDGKNKYAPQRKPLTDEQPQRWAVFCGICRKEWTVPYQHPGKSVCRECEAAHGIKE